MQTSSNRNVWILSTTLFVVMLGFGLIVPILPFYMDSLGAGGTELGLLIASYAVMRLIFGPIWGSLSDRIGRKPVLVIGILGYGITMIGFGLATKLWMLFAARCLSGILSSATSPTTMAYIGDSTAESERSRGMGILGATIGLGTIFGPGVGGILGEKSLSLPFFIAAGVSFVAMLLIIVWLPESLPPEKRVNRTIQGEKNKKDRFSTRQIGQLLQPIWILLVAAFLASFALTMFSGIFGLYALEKFTAGPQAVGVILMVSGVVSALAQGVLTAPLTRRWGEATLIKVSLAGTALGFLAIVLSGSYPVFLISTGFFSLAAALLNPAVSGAISQKTSANQGVTMGWSNSVMSLGRIAGPSWAGFAFDRNIEIPFLSGVGLVLAGMIVCLVWLRSEPTAQKAPKSTA